MNSGHCSNVTVRRKPGAAPHLGLLSISNFTFPCLLGRNGITTTKFEGDGATPAGQWRIMYGLYRPDRISIPATRLPMSPILPDDGWCDAPGNSNYNRPVKLPYRDGHEELFRKDRLYDVCLVLDYNISTRIQHRGSAVFFHLSNPNQKPTAGCVAVEPETMLYILSMISDQTILQICR